MTSRLQRRLIALAAMPLVLYAGDWLAWRLRGAPRAQVEIITYYAVPAKGNKETYYPGEASTEDCAVSAFGHGGLDSCLRLRRSSHRRVDL